MKTTLHRICPGMMMIEPAWGTVWVCVAFTDIEDTKTLSLHATWIKSTLDGRHSVYTSREVYRYAASGFYIVVDP